MPCVQPGLWRLGAQIESAAHFISAAVKDAPPSHPCPTKQIPSDRGIAHLTAAPDRALRQPSQHRRAHHIAVSLRQSSSLPPTPTLHSCGPLFGAMCTPISTHTKFHIFRRPVTSGPQPPHGGSAPSVSAPARFAASPTLQPGTDAVPHPPFRAMSFAASGPPRRELRGCVSVGRWAAGAPGRGTGGRGLGPCLQYRRTCPSSCQCPLDLRDLRLSQCSA